MMPVMYWQGSIFLIATIKTKTMTETDLKTHVMDAFNLGSIGAFDKGTDISNWIKDNGLKVAVIVALVASNIYVITDDNKGDDDDDENDAPRKRVLWIPTAILSLLLLGQLTGMVTK